MIDVFDGKFTVVILSIEKIVTAVLIVEFMISTIMRNWMD